MAEVIFRFLLEFVFCSIVLLLGRIGYWITRGAVAIIGGNRIHVAPPPNNYVVVPRWHGLHRLTDGTPVISEWLASTLGLFLLFIWIVGFFLVVKFLRT